MIRFAIHLLLVTLIASAVNAGRIPNELFDTIQSKAKEIYANKAVGYNGNDCDWDYLTPDREYFYIYNQVYKFGETSFYAFGCSYGAYNFWQVWLREEQTLN